MMRPLKWIAIGGALMYYLDPERGRSRRAAARGRIARLLNRIDHEIEVTSRDVANRTHGLIARTRSVLSDDHASDAVIAARVRARLGREVSHPRAIMVTAAGGHVTLAGDIPAAELGRLVKAVRSVRGVATVEDRLRVHDRPKDHPALRGGRPRKGRRAERWQVTWSPSVRLLAGAAIGAAALRTTGTRRLAGAALGVLGAAWVAHRLTEGIPRRDRTSGGPRPLVATGAPVHDVAIPIHRTRYGGPEIGL
jgi:hypothetical protein